MDTKQSNIFNNIKNNKIIIKKCQQQIFIDIKNISKFTENLDSIDINQQDSDGDTILHILFTIDTDTDVIVKFTKILLNKNVNLFIYNYKRQIPEYILSENLNKELKYKIFDLLHSSKQYRNSIHYHSYTGNYQKIKEVINEQKHLLNIELSLYEKGDLKFYPLTFLLSSDVHYKDHSEKICEMIKLFVENGTDINSIDKDGNNILHCLIINNLFMEVEYEGYKLYGGYGSGYEHKNCLCLRNIVKCLVECGINVNQKNNNNETPLELLCSKKYSYIMYYSDIRKIFDILVENMITNNKEEYDKMISNISMLCI